MTKRGSLHSRRISIRSVRRKMLEGRSESTKRAYANDLALFVSWSGGDTLKALQELLSSKERAAYLAQSWLDSMRFEVSAATCRRRIAALRAFVRAARVLGRVRWRLALTVPKEPQELQRKPWGSPCNGMLGGTRCREREED